MVNYFDRVARGLTYISQATEDVPQGGRVLVPGKFP